MPHLLEQKVASVAHRRRCVAIAISAAKGLAAILGAVMLACLCDYLFRYRDPGIRFLSTAAVLAVSVWVIVRWILPAARLRLQPIGTAREIEQHYPLLGERLSSAIAFLGERDDDPYAGSIALRRAVVHDTVATLEQIDLTTVVDHRPAIVAIRWAIVVAVLAIGVGLCDLQAARISFARLVLPWQSREWPRKNYLRVSGCPARVAVGSDVDFEVVDEGGRLPDRVWLELQSIDSETPAVAKDLIVMTQRGDRAVHRLLRVTESFRYRVRGGDDESEAWIAVEVLPPPKVEHLEWQIDPPSYTGWPRERNAGPQLRAIAGSRLQLFGKASLPLSSVRLRDAAGKLLLDRSAVRLSKDRLSFEVSPADDAAWIAEHSTTLHVEVEDERGIMADADHGIMLHVIPDAAPAVGLASKEFPAYVTPQAKLPLRIFVKDDLAIRDVRVEIRNAVDGQTLFQNEVARFDLPRFDEERGHGEGQSLSLEWLLPFDEVPNLVPGASLEVGILASDFKPQTGRMAERRLSVISVEELEERLAAEQSAILRQLADALREQIECRARVRDLSVAAGGGETFTATDQAALQVSEVRQRSISTSLGHDASGAIGRLDALLEAMAINGIEQNENGRRVAVLREHVATIRKEYAELAHRELANAGRLGRESEPADSAMVERDRSVKSALAAQDRVVSELESLLAQFSHWDDYRRFASDLARLRRSEEELIGVTIAQLQKSLSGDAADSATELQQSLAHRLADRQLELSQRLDKMQSQWMAVEREMRDGDAEAADRLAKAVAALDELSTVGKLRETSRLLDQRRWGAATEQQQESVHDLEQLQAILSGATRNSLANRKAELEGAKQSLEKFAERQAELADRRADGQQQADADLRKAAATRLGEDLSRLAKELQGFAKRMDESSLKDQSATVADSASHDREAANAVNEDAWSQAADAMAAATARLQDALAKLNAELGAVRESEAEQRLMALIASLEKLLGEQGKQLERWQALPRSDASSDDASTVPPLQVAWIENHRQLVDASERLERDWTDSPAIEFALQRTTRATRDAVAAAAEQPAETVRRVEQTITQIADLLKALSPSSSPADAAESATQEGPEAPGQPQQDRSAARPFGLAELKVIQGLQVEVNRRTEELEMQRIRRGSWSEKQRREVDLLTEDQQSILGMLQALLQVMDSEKSDR